MIMLSWPVDPQKIDGIGRIFFKVELYDPTEVRLIQSLATECVPVLNPSVREQCPSQGPRLFKLLLGDGQTLRQLRIGSYAEDSPCWDEAVENVGLIEQCAVSQSVVRPVLSRIIITRVSRFETSNNAFHHSRAPAIVVKSDGRGWDWYFNSVVLRRPLDTRIKDLGTSTENNAYWQQIRTISFDCQIGGVCSLFRGISGLIGDSKTDPKDHGLDDKRDELEGAHKNQQTGEMGDLLFYPYLFVEVASNLLGLCGAFVLGCGWYCSGCVLTGMSTLILVVDFASFGCGGGLKALRAWLFC